MKSLMARFLVILVVLFTVSSCATVSTEQKEPLAPGELKLVSVQFPETGRIRQGMRYLVSIKFESDGKAEVRRACVYWDARGPNCFPIMDVSPGERVIRTDVVTPPNGYYIMKCYVLYVRDGKTIRSNMVETTVDVTA
jgi:hypothetical protein